MQSVLIREATRNDSEIISTFVYQLLLEQFPEDTTYNLDNLHEAAQRILTQTTTYWAFIAFIDDNPVGMIGLNECTSVYAFGHFGEITELYVMPDYRSHGVGAALHKKVIEFGKDRGWSMMEVATAEVPRWQRTVDFYKKVGFKEVGPRLYHLL